MSGTEDFIRKKYRPLQDKTLRNALAHQMATHFPTLGGPRSVDLCAEIVLEVIQDQMRPLEHVQHGQALWMGYGIDDPPARYKRTAEMELVPLVLDLSTAEDVEARLDRKPKPQRLLDKALRLCHQAYAQGALLSNCDLAELLATDDAVIAKLLSSHERETGKVVPRRATVHDVGSGVTHKRIILRKRYLEGKAPEQIARETYHSLDAVDRYLGQYDRVRHCRHQGLKPVEIAYALDCSLSLVQEYLDLDQELEAPAT